MPLGFKLNDLRPRYDVPIIHEDPWHKYSGEVTAGILARSIPPPSSEDSWLLNAGAGVYPIRKYSWRAVSVDIFTTPISTHKYPVCASVERLPFAGSTFSIIVCVGEVLAYCDPAKAIREFARVIANSGRLICDFRSSRSLRYLRSKTFGRAADLIHDEYNGTPEPTWVYDPQYIRAILHLAGFRIRSEFGIHTWSNLARRLGSSTELALTFQRYLASMPFPVKWADLITIVADRI